MPGFFMTFIILCFAAGWARFLAHRIGESWPLYPPGIGIGIWCILTVFGVVTTLLVSGSGVDTQGDGQKLARVLTAALYTRYLSVAVLFGMVPVTIVAWLRPVAPEPGQGHS